MPQLIISQLELQGSAGASNYFATTDNGEVHYQFVGDSLDEQFGNVQMLANYMYSGQNAVIGSLDSVLELGDVSVDSAVSELFEANDELAYAGEVLAPDVVSIWSDLEEFATWLLALVMG